MNLLQTLNKPQYVFQPTRCLHRILRHRSRQQGSGWGETVLPWGLPLTFHTGEYIGSEIAKLGLYDLCVSETLYRLLDPGELAVDAGANIGQMTSLLAARAGAAGRVLAFEPHPDVFKELSVNVSRWATRAGL